MERVGDLVDRIWSSFELDKLSDREKALEFWPEAVGEKVSAFCFVEGFQESTIKIRAINPGVAMELKYRSSEILAALNEAAGKELFRSLRIILRPPSDRER